MSLSDLLEYLDGDSFIAADPDPETAPIWIGSVGYERFQHNEAFATMLAAEGVERLIDVRDLPISRKHGFAKTALTQALAERGIEYVHAKLLGNPKEFRDLYKSGKIEAGRSRYQAFLLEERVDALRELVSLIREKRSALMCVEHDEATCHRNVIFCALSEELGLDVLVNRLD